MFGQNWVQFKLSPASERSGHYFLRLSTLIVEMSESVKCSQMGSEDTQSVREIFVNNHLWVRYRLDQI